MGAIKVVDYDPGWPDIFEREKSLIAKQLGDMACDVHHIGSTSVVGLAAKPKIDIDVVVRTDAIVSEAVAQIMLLPDLTFHGDPYGDGMWTFTSGRGSYGTRLYVCGPDNAKHVKRILFRDWLRAHPDDAAQYAALKRRLALTANDDWTAYTGGKSAFINAIVGRASV